MMEFDIVQKTLLRAYNGSILGNNVLELINKHYNIVNVKDKNQYQCCSIDLTLNNKLKKMIPNSKYNNDIPNSIDTKKKIQYEEIEFNEYYLPPHEFILASTSEFINLKDINEDFINYYKCGITGFICGKSSIARLGLIIESAGLIDPGFYGNITLEIYNQTNHYIKLYTDMPICHIYFVLSIGLTKLYNGKYINQKGTTESRYYLNFNKY